jgi:hypothetical protein
MSMYIRVKRQKQTIFLYTEPQEQIKKVKWKISKLNNIPIEKIRLILEDIPLEDEKTIQDYKIENDRIVYLVYKKDEDGEWEPIQVSKPSLTSSEKTDK